MVYLNHPDPIAFIPLAVDTTGRLYDEFIRLLFLYAHREASALANELPEESDKFRFLRASCFANLKGAVGLILAKASAMRIPIPRVHVMYDSLTHQLGPSNRCTCRVLTEVWVRFIGDILGDPLGARVRMSSYRHVCPQRVRVVSRLTSLQTNPDSAIPNNGITTAYLKKKVTLWGDSETHER